eukprot:gene6604-4726_t
MLRILGSAPSVRGSVHAGHISGPSLIARLLWGSTGIPWTSRLGASLSHQVTNVPTQVDCRFSCGEVPLATLTGATYSPPNRAGATSNRLSGEKKFLGHRHVSLHWEAQMRGFEVIIMPLLFRIV